MNKGEQERKELNRKLLRRTVASELKDRRRVKALDLGMDFVTLFIALLLADLTVKFLAIDLWFVELIITALIASLVLYVKALFSNKGDN